MADYRSLDYSKPHRPPFERMIGDLERAKKMWDTKAHRSFNTESHMHEYSLSLLKLVGMMAAEESSEREKERV
jgi:hypothetical protein